LSDFHTIRLHGPWQATVLESFEPSSLEDELTCRVQIPADWDAWLGPSFRGRVGYRRSFGLPTGLESDQRIWLIIESVDFRASVVLNGQALGTLKFEEAPLRVDVSHFLRSANELWVEVELPKNADRGERAGLAGGLIGSVRLEIEE
jgi:beta-galactosidase/beta-glucuronidase